jgi:eukaryotic-like serine/threonine-protein kinase
MPIAIGARLGPYEIVGPLGTGGMGEVYRARDTKLDREVAIKVLPELFVADPERVARFQREAKTLAALNHPHIGGIYGLEDAGGVHALVLELVEGPTLADRIAQAPIPLDEALPVARQIAEALEAAHEAGIIHRDLRPANIKLRPDGTVKVLDFGLAKALQATATSTNVTASPTITTPAMMTGVGMILGTAAYMSPEQARGKPADRRSDVWAFGVVLFEIVAGCRPFGGEEISDTLASILKTEPDWTALPPQTPSAIHRLLYRCLEKDPRRRLQHFGDARLEIDETQRAPVEAANVVHREPSRAKQLAWMLAVALAAIAVGVMAGRRMGDAPAASEVRLDISTMPTNMVTSFAISPDGRAIVLNGNGPRGGQLWIRTLDSTAVRPLPGTESGQFPFWSPDGKSIGFFVDNQLKRLDVDGGQPQRLASVVTPAGGTWNSDGTILYVPNDNAGIRRISAAGGNSTEVTPRRSPSLAIRLPQFLPDGRRFIFYVARGGEPRGVYVGELGSEAIRRVADADLPAAFGAGHLWLIRERTLFAQRFDPATAQTIGPVIRVADSVGAGLIGAALSVSNAGPVAFRAFEGQGTRHLTWFDRSGRALGTVGDEGGLVSNPASSADGQRVVVQRTVQDNTDLWIVDLRRNVSTRLTFDPGIDSMPIWSPDGTRIAFNTPGGRALYVIKRVDGTGDDEPLRLPSGGGTKILCDWSPDGRFILYKHLDDATSTNDLWAMPVSSGLAPIPIVRTPADERDGQFSPDGKWVAYESDESGQSEIYVQPFPGPAAKTRVSTGGATQVRWRTELFYVAPSGDLMAVAVKLWGAQVTLGAPAALFRTHFAPVRSISRQQYVVARDGQRFLIVTVAENAPPPITLVLNWKPPAAR